jgi:predicted secreted protein
MALKGRSMKIMTGANGTAWAEVLGIKEASMQNGADNLDISTFGNAYIKRLQGLKDCSYSLSGLYEPTDTTGQVAIRNAWANDTALYIGFLPDGSAGFEQIVFVSSFEISGAVDGVVEVSIDLEGSDAIAAYA